MSARESQRIAEKFHSAGLRLTTERRLLLNIIDRNAHCDATEIFQLARAENPRISLATVYRTLRVLKDMGMVHASGLGEDHTHYEVRRKPHVHLVCDACGKILDLPAPIAIDKLAAQNGYTVMRAKLEIYGLCPACQAEQNHEIDA